MASAQPSEGSETAWLRPAGTWPSRSEVTTLAEAYEALDRQVEWIMLDNMSTDVIRSVVEQRDASGSGCWLEASGTISLETVADIAASGVDALSVGALTHSAPALDTSPLISPFEPQEQTVRP